MYRNSSRALAVVILLGSCAARLNADLIDFEQTPALGTPLDDAALSAPYNLSGGGTVSFYFDNNSNFVFDSGIDDEPIFEAAGADGNDAFTSTATGINDTAAPGFGGQLGNFLVRHPAPGPPPNPFIVDYNTGQTITALSGEIWDIDGVPQGTERWLVEVLDGSNNVLASQLSPIGNSLALDSLPWVFMFSGLPAGVDKVSLTFVGTKINNVGLAFNNFNPTAVPEPASVALMGGAVCGLIVVARRRRHSGMRATRN